MKLVFVVAAAAAFLPIAPSYAENVAYVSANGSGITCTAAAPCASVLAALVNIAPPIRIICLSGSEPDGGGITFDQNVSIDIDCPLGVEAQLGFSTLASNATMRLRHLGFWNVGFSNQIIFQGAGTLILEDCVFTDSPSTALDIEPNGPLNVVIKNSRISNGGAGIFIKPAAGGSVKATLDHVTITNNNGGGIKTDTTNGPVTVDITDSVVSKNSGNGLNAVGGAGGPNMLFIKNSVIASNGSAGVQANGATAAALVNNALLDSNTAGATSAVNSGRVLTYSNNSIVGSSGSGFTGAAPLQ